MNTRLATTPGSTMDALLRMCAVMLLCLNYSLSAIAQAADDAQPVFVLMRSSDAGPYLQAQQAALDELARENRPTMVNPSEDELRDLRTSESAITYITIGQAASVRALQIKRESDSIVYTLVVDPASAGLTDDKSVSGISSSVAIRDQIRIMQETKPRLSRIGYLYRSSGDGPKLHTLQEQGELDNNVELVAIDLDAYDNSADAIGDLFGADVDFVWTEPDSSIFNRAMIKQVLLQSVRNKVPVLGFSQAFVKAGGLLGFAISPEDQGRDAATLAIELSGSTNQTRSVHLYAEGSLVINQVVAKTLNVRIPRSVSAKAQIEFE